MPETTPRAPADVFALPAAIPATWVAWLDCSASKGFVALRHFGDAGANARAAITFGVVNAVLPRGKPAGYA
jgi:hypothetical protein